MKIIKSLTVLALCLWPATRVMAAGGDIDIDTSSVSTPAAGTPTVSTDATTGAAPAEVSTSSVLSTQAAAPIVSTVAPTQAATEATNPTSSENTAAQPVILAVTPTPGEGVFKMKDLYKAGLAYYKKEDFANAIRYLKESLQIHDPYTPKFYYAEANAILGVIYQFHIIDKNTAYYYYQAALKIDPTTETAKKHVKEVTPDTD